MIWYDTATPVNLYLHITNMRSNVELITAYFMLPVLEVSL